MIKENKTSKSPSADSFMKRVRKVLKRIPKGKIATYGHIAALAGNPRAARQVVRLLHSCSDKDKLPWHRVINSKGSISLKRGQGYELQKAMLLNEGVVFDKHDAVDLSRYLWTPRSPALRKDSK